MADAQAPTFDPKDFSNEEYLKKVDKPWGYELHWVLHRRKPKQAGKSWWNIPTRTR